MNPTKLVCYYSPILKKVQEMSEQNLPTYQTELTNEHVAVTPEAQTMLAQLLDDADDEFTAIRDFCPRWRMRRNDL